MARKLFYISSAMLMLALSYHFGFSTASAQAPGNPVVAMSDPWILTANGDVYRLVDGTTGQAVHLNNIFSGPPTPAVRESWGQLKARYR